jgi:hypothetical protein
MFDYKIEKLEPIPEDWYEKAPDSCLYTSNAAESTKITVDALEVKND